MNVTVTGENAVVEGMDLILNCSAVSDPEPTFQWLRSGGSLPSKVTDASSPQLVVPSMTWSDVGVYYCLAVNDGGASYSPAVYVLLQAEQGAVISYGKGAYNMCRSVKIVHVCTLPLHLNVIFCCIAAY